MAQTSERQLPYPFCLLFGFNGADVDDEEEWEPSPGEKGFEEEGVEEIDREGDSDKFLLNDDGDSGTGLSPPYALGSTEDMSLNDMSMESDLTAEDMSGLVGGTDKLSKARLDLLFRFMDSAEAKESKPGILSQRQKLQRKLLLRSAAAEVAKEDGGGGNDVAASTGEADDLLKDSQRIETLLRELGEGDASSQKVSLHGAASCAPKKAARAKVTKHRKDSRGGISGSSKRTSFKESTSVSATKLEKLQEAPAEVSAPATSRLPSTTAAPEEEASDEEIEVDVDKEGKSVFQVVSTRKTKRKERKEVRDVEDPVDMKIEADKNERVIGVANRDSSDRGACTETLPETGENSRNLVAEATLASVSSECRRIPSDSVPEVDICNAVGVDDDMVAPPLEVATGAQDEYDVDSKAANSVAAGDEAEDEEEWEWQCPDGNQLARYVCPRQTECCSCGQIQAQGASVLRSDISGWVACEECVYIAFQQPVELLPAEGFEDEEIDASEGMHCYSGTGAASGSTDARADSCLVDRITVALTRDDVCAAADHGVEDAVRRHHAKSLQPRRRLQPRSEEYMEAACQENRRLAGCTAVGSNEGDSVDFLDPSRMSAVEIAEWFKKHGAEDTLRHCMFEVMRSHANYQRTT